MAVSVRGCVLTPRLRHLTQICRLCSRRQSSQTSVDLTEDSEIEKEDKPSSLKDNSHRRRYAEENPKKKWRFTSEFKEAVSQDLYPPFMLDFGKASTLNVPSNLETAITTVQEKYTKGQHKNLQENAKRFINQLVCRKRPMERDEISHHGNSLQQHMVGKVLSKKELRGQKVGEEDLQQLNENVRQKVIKALRKHVYHHQQIEYDSEQALMYMDGLIRSNYQHLTAIFREIKKRLPSYKPRTMLDFGSGLGSAMWAANTVWPTQLYEFMNIDQSGDMNTLAQLLVQGGKEDGAPLFKEVYFRRFLPATSDRPYSLVVCDLTLLELQDMNSRLETLYNLWSKTEDFLIVTEFGTQAGFHTILEARQFLLELHQNQKIKNADQLKGHVFAPCPHDNSCPKLATHGICKFSQSPHGSPRTCYVVLRKGERVSEENFPRVIKGPHLSQNTYAMELCCPDGQLRNAAVQKKTTDRDNFRLMKKYRHGDLIPLEEIENEEPIQ